MGVGGGEWGLVRPGDKLRKDYSGQMPMLGKMRTQLEGCYFNLDHRRCCLKFQIFVIVYRPDARVGESLKEEVTEDG